MSDAVRVAVAPDHHEWYSSVLKAVAGTEAEVAEPAQAEALVWLGKQGDDLRDYLHPGIRWVQLRAAGVEHWFETGEIDDKRVFTCSRGAYAETVAEHAIALILASARRLQACARKKQWDRELSKGGRVLRGSTVGVIGAGGIGQEVVNHLQSFGVNIIAVTRSGRTVPGAHQSLAASAVADAWPHLDYAVILAPSTKETDQLVGKAALDAMPDDAWVINVARGTLVDTDALVAALHAGTIGGAALDVTDPEPLPDGHPLWDLPNVLITPHSANPKQGQHHLLERRITDNIGRYVRGEQLLAVVNLELGY